MIEYRRNRLTAVQLFFPRTKRAVVTQFWPWPDLSTPAFARHLLDGAQKTSTGQVMRHRTTK